jgi:hypothetical protein
MFGRKTCQESEASDAAYTKMKRIMYIHDPSYCPINAKVP